jgi:hypothetical protein
LGGVGSPRRRLRLRQPLLPVGSCSPVIFGSACCVAEHCVGGEDLLERCVRRSNLRLVVGYTGVGVMPA